MVYLQNKVMYAEKLIYGIWGTVLADDLSTVQKNTRASFCCLAKLFLKTIDWIEVHKFLSGEGIGITQSVPHVASEEKGDAL